MITATVDIINTTWAPSLGTESDRDRASRQRRQMERRGRMNRRANGPLTRIADFISGHASQIYSVAPSNTLAEAARALDEQDVGLLTICDVRGALIGVFTDADFRRALTDMGPDALEMTLDEFMMPAQWTASPSNTLEYAMTIMSSQNLMHLPVVENGVVIAILDAATVIRAHQDAL